MHGLQRKESVDVCVLHQEGQKRAVFLGLPLLLPIRKHSIGGSPGFESVSAFPRVELICSSGIRVRVLSAVFLSHL